MVIDAHHHLGQEKDYADKLIDTMAKLGVDKTVLLATNTTGPGSSNEEIEKAIKKHPDKLVGFGWLDPALDPHAEDTVQQLFDHGFKGLKFIKTRKAYDDRSYYSHVSESRRPRNAYSLPSGNRRAPRQ